MKTVRVGFIGGGNMASSLIGGLLARDYTPDNIWVTDHHPEKLVHLKTRYQVNIVDTSAELIHSADILVFAVKPNEMKKAVQELSSEISKTKPLILSIAAGVRIAAFEKWLGGVQAIVRCMPNTPALVSCGATALYANPNVSAEQRNHAEAILRSVGLTVWLTEEKQLDTVTALSGSGPAYFFLMMEALEQGAVQLGLAPEAAHLLTLQTALGAARMAMETSDSMEVLRKQVTSPGGTTEAAINVLEKNALRESFTKALSSAASRARELGDEVE